MTNRTLTDANRQMLAARFPVLTENSLSGETDDSATAQERDDNLSDILGPEAYVSSFYERRAPGFLAAYTAMAELPEIAHIAESAVEADRQARSADVGGSWVIFTTRPGERYSLEDQQVFDVAVQMSDQDIACDLDMFGTGYCVTELEMIRKHNLTYSPKVGKFLNQAFTFPLHHHEYVILARICFECWIKLVKQYKMSGPAILNPWQMF